MHEVLLDGSALPIKILDLAKRMIDFQVHPPTLVGAGCVYFGKELSNAMLFEPTETETKETLENFAKSMNEINMSIDEKAEYLKQSPYQTPVRRLDETKANRELDINYYG